MPLRYFGDSNLVRYLNFRGKNDSPYKYPRRLQGAISGATIKEILEEALHAKDFPRKAVIMVGTNDLLRLCQKPKVSLKFWLSKCVYLLRKFRDLLCQHCRRVVWLTVPPCPRLEDNKRYHWARRQLNLQIHNLSSDVITVVDHDDDDLDRTCFEQIMGEGQLKRPDLIHFNSKGFKHLRKKIRQGRKSAKSKKRSRSKEEVEV